jgi:hypothetical protein
VAAAALLIWTVILNVVVRPVTSAPWLPPLALGLAIAAIAVQFRANAQGVAVSEPGIRVRSTWRTRVVPWSDVRQVLVVDDPRYRNRNLVIEAHGRERIRTPIYRSDLRPFRSTGPLGHVALSGRDLDALAQALDEMARSRGEGSAGVRAAPGSGPSQGASVASGGTPS